MGARAGPLLGIILIWLISDHADSQAVTKDAIVKRLFKNYDPTIKPNNGTSGQPTRVEVNYYVRDMYIVDQSMRYIGAQLTFRQKWNDERLSYPETQFQYLSVSDPKKLWLPDIFFSNNRKGHFNDLMEPNVLLRISPNGDILYSRRITSDFKCQTDSKMFPLNKINCPVLTAAYGSSTDDIILEWAQETPVQMSKLLMPTYRLKSYSTGYCTARTVTGEYSCLKATFILERCFGSSFYILYLPPLLLVLLSWVSFFMHRRALKLRLALLAICMLLGSVCCLTAQWQDPDRLVMTAADAWAGLCLAFVSYALLHFVLTRSVPCLSQICGYEDKEDAVVSNDITLQPMMVGDGGEQGGDNSKVKGKLQATSARLRHLVAKKRNRADVIARMLYPCAFIVFNIVYWAVYNEGGNN